MRHTAAVAATTRPRGWETARPRDLVGDRRLIDAAAAPVAFVAANRLADLALAAGAAVTVAALVTALRVARGQRVRYALGGLGGVGVAAGAAVWTGEASNYFAPAAALNAAYAAVAVASVLAGRPLAGWLSALLRRAPLAWHWHPRVRPAFTEVTWAWAALFALRASARYGLIVRGQLELLAVVHVALGVPAFAALLALTWWHVPRRLRALDAPPPTPPVAEAPSRGPVAGA